MWIQEMLGSNLSQETNLSWQVFFIFLHPLMQMLHNTFTMETESEGHLTFLDLDIYRRPDGSLGHKVYRNSTHNNLYLNTKSHHHPSKKQAVLSTLGAQGQSSL
jgi:hypothetical protein